MSKVRIMELRGTYKGGGGPDKTVLLSAAKHNEEDFFVLVTYLRSPDDDDFQIGKMAEYYGVPHYIEIFDRSMIDFRCLLKLTSLIKQYKIDIVHTHDLKTSMLGVLLKLLNPFVKIMYTAHGWIVHNQMDSLKHSIQYRFLKIYPLHIAVSKATKQLMIDSGINEKKIKVLYNSIDTGFWRKDKNISTLKQEYGILPHSPVIGTVGRLSKEKDIPTFFKTAQRVLESFPDSIFIIVGDGKGPIVDELKELAKDMGIERSVIFTGHRTDLKNIYCAFDIFLMTSLTEGLPNTVLEAMALEIPVISTGVGGVPELITDSESGILCDKGDFLSLSEAVKSLLGNEDKRKNISLNAKKRIEDRFSFESRLSQIEQFYIDLKNTK